MAVLVYDIETKKLADQVEGGWDNPKAMGLGVACVYSYVENKYNFFMPDQEDQLEGSLKDNYVVSYNGKAFDSCIVQQTNDPDFLVWNDIDLLELIICHKHNVSDIPTAFREHGKFNVLNGSLGLDAVGKATLGIGKSGKFSSLAPGMLHNGHWGDLFGYVLQDVRVLKLLFEFILKNQYVIDGHGNKIGIQDVWKFYGYEAQLTYDKTGQYRLQKSKLKGK